MFSSKRFACTSKISGAPSVPTCHRWCLPELRSTASAVKILSLLRWNTTCRECDSGACLSCLLQRESARMHLQQRHYEVCAVCKLQTEAIRKEGMSEDRASPQSGALLQAQVAGLQGGTAPSAYCVRQQGTRPGTASGTPPSARDALL